MDKAKIINQINLKDLTDNFTEDQIDNALINMFLRENKIKTQNRLILTIINSEDKEITDKVNSFMVSRKILLDLMTLEKLFELMQGRCQKKLTGTFYTPYYIVDYMVNNIIVDDCKVVDPSCGSGAFLVGATKRLHELTKKRIIDIIENNIYGVDVSAKAIRRSKLILTLFSLMANEDSERINFNLLEEDSLLLDWNKSFPEVFSEGGFDAVIGNPPYTKLSNDYDPLQLEKKYKVLSQNANKVNLYLFFLELSLNISKKHTGRSAMIVPLSIAFNLSEPFVKIRDIFYNTRGNFKFSFYDRSPDSLFGDNIKTRNSIIFLEKNEHEEFTVFSTRLMRWNSREREELFNNLIYQNLYSFPIQKGIPKISTELEFTVLRNLDRSGCRFKDFIEMKSGKDFRDKKNIYFYSTAYNWLSVFREILEDLNYQNDRKESSSLKMISCRSEEHADIMYSILNSKLIYWYWLVLGDGFHLTSSFIAQIPINIELISREGKRKLIYLCNKLNREIKNYPISKVNKNKLVRNYNILRCGPIIDQIDITLNYELKIDPNFLKFLSTMYINHISAGRADFKNKTNLSLAYV